MARETPAEKVRREQREVMNRANAARDAKMTTRQQNDMRMRGAPPRPAAVASTPARATPAPGAAARARNERIDEVVEKATGEKRGGGRRGGR